ncbi:MAG: InlB B-repeat-containing protein [Bacteroidales bacterium]|nr:InlB B-repeat-containing protein [Candidatus Egerieousia equi]
MKLNFRTIFAALFAMTLMVFAMPQKTHAADYKEVVKLAVYDSKGNYVSSPTDFTSKNFSQTINSKWAETTAYAWSPNGLEYNATWSSSSSGSTSTIMPKPTDLWNYDASKYEFVGGAKQLTSTPSYAANGWKSSFTDGYYGGLKLSISYSGTDWFYYIFKEKAPQVTYTLNYNTKGGTPTINAQTITNNTGSATFTISSTVPSKEKYNFLGWSATDGGAVAYNPGGSLTTSNENTTIYAVWEKILLPGNLTISCEGLQNEESAVIEVKNGNSVLYRVSVSSDSPSVTIKGISVGTYTVAPMDWSWTYETMDSKSVTIEEEQTASVSFTAVKKTSIEPKYDENKKVVK